MPGVYRIEYSPNKRAGCQSTECKKEAIKIQKGELRFGTFVTIMEHQSWRWKHWGCVTPLQISNLRDSVEDEIERYLDGYDDLNNADKAKVAKAVEEGHVADDDWKGDVEVNRPGQKGFRTPASKKKARDDAQAAKARQEANEDRHESPSVPAERKKRRREKKEVDAANDDGFGSKKAKTALKKGKKTKTEKHSEHEPQPLRGRKQPAKPKSEGQSTAPIKAEGSDAEGLSSAPAKTLRGVRKAAAKKIKSEDIDLEDDEPMPSSEEEGVGIKFEVPDFEDKAEASDELPKTKKRRKSAAKIKDNSRVPASKPKGKPDQPVVVAKHPNEAAADVLMQKIADAAFTQRPTRASGRKARSSDV